MISVHDRAFELISKMDKYKSRIRRRTDTDKAVYVFLNSNNQELPNSDIDALEFALDQHWISHVDSGKHGLDYELTAAGRHRLKLASTDEEEQNLRQEEDSEFDEFLVTMSQTDHQVKRTWTRQEYLKYAFGWIERYEDKHKLALELLAAQDMRLLTEEMLNENRQLGRDTNRLANKTNILAWFTCGVMVATFVVAAVPIFQSFGWLPELKIEKLSNELINLKSQQQTFLTEFANLKKNITQTKTVNSLTLKKK